MKRFSFVLAVIVAAATGACTAAPTAPEPVAPPSFDGTQLPPAEGGEEEGESRGGSIAVSGG
jgi:hypothetical protein